MSQQFGQSGTIYDAVPQQEFTLLAGAGQVLNEQIHFPAYSLVIDNPTNQWLHVVNTNHYIPPGVLGFVVRVPALGRVQVEWAAPIGQTQALPIPGASALIIALYEQLPPGSAVTQVGIVTTLPQLTVAGLTDLQGGLQVEGGARFSGVPIFDFTHPSFGGVGDNATDNTAAWLKVFAAVPLSGGIIFFPPLTPSGTAAEYFFGSGIQADGSKPIWILGTASGQQPGQGTILRFAAGVSGITLLNGAGGNGSRSRIEAIRVIGADIAPGTNDGIHVQANQAQLVNVEVESFGGYGVNIDSATGDVAHNANMVRMDHVRCFQNWSGGFHTFGVNANAGTLTMCDASNQNGGWGIFEEGALGNFWFGVHLAGNAAGGIRLGASSGFARMYGVYWESENKQALQIDASNSGQNIVDFAHAARNDGASPVTDNSGGTNFIILNAANNLHSRLFVVGQDTAAGNSMSLDGAGANTELRLFGARIRWQDNPLTTNWTAIVDANKRLFFSSAQKAGLITDNPIYPAAFNGATQTIGALYFGTGVPSNANGANGDWYFRTDVSAAGARIYHKEAGAWVATAA